jgi:hypothetical protein
MTEPTLATVASPSAIPHGILAALCLFNHCPADYLHPSRRRDFVPEIDDEALWESPRARSHLSRLVLRRLELRNCLERDRPEWPLALLPAGRLPRLGRHVAAALAGAQLRNCISRADVLAWREWLSPEAHEFALTSANLLPRVPHAGVQREGTQAQDLGFGWIAAATRDWPDAIGRRMALKLPPTATAGHAGVPPELAQRVVRSILSIVEPAWCSSFAKTRR